MGPEMGADKRQSGQHLVLVLPGRCLGASFCPPLFPSGIHFPELCAKDMMWKCFSLPEAGVQFILYPEEKHLQVSIDVWGWDQTHSILAFRTSSFSSVAYGELCRCY